MNSRAFDGIAMELALHAAGHRFPRLSQVGAAWATETGPPTEVSLSPPYAGPRSFDISCSGHAIFLLDVTWTVDAKVRLIEMNGSNAALTSAVLGKDDRRALHMFLTYESKKKPAGQVVALLAYQRGLIHVPEFFGRASIFAARVADTQTTRLCDTSEALGNEEVSVVCGSIDDIADHVSVHDGRLAYKGRLVAFATNPNLLPELVRRGVVRTAESGYDVDYTVYHEGHTTPLVHDKAAQQAIATGTGIEPLIHLDGHSVDDCLPKIREFHQRGLVAVGKMNAGSGAAGIEFFPPDHTDHQIAESIGRLLNTAVRKYGAAVMNSMFPIRFFEFVQSTPYDLYGRGHLWDLRVECLVYPGRVQVTPCVIRLCPEPFDPTTFKREGVVSNLTGTDPDGMARRLKSPAAMRRSLPGVSVLDSVGVGEEVYTRLAKACARWAERAMHLYAGPQTT